MKIGLIALNAVLATLFAFVTWGWHRETVFSESRQVQNAAQLADAWKEADNCEKQMGSMRDALVQVAQENIALRKQSKQMAQAYLDQYAGNQKIVEAAEKVNQDLSESSAKARSDADALSQENATLKAALLAPHIPSVTPQNPLTTLPVSTTTSGTIIHPDGSMSEIFLDSTQ